MLSRLVFQGASVLISWLQSPCAGILEPKKIKSLTVSIVSPSICHEVGVGEGVKCAWKGSWGELDLWRWGRPERSASVPSLLGVG